MKRPAGIILCCLFLACAVMEAPTGGPEDKLPPRVVSITPRPDSAGVAPDSDLQIRFSEKLDGDSFKNRVFTYPAIDFKKIKVKGDLVTVEFAESLPETTVTVLIKAGYQDNHLVKSPDHISFSFSAAGAIDTGIVAGRILFKRQPDSTGVAKLFVVKPDSIVNPSRTRESRIAFADRRGYFIFRALPTAGARFILWTFSDKNGDGSYAEGSEFSTLFPDTIMLAAERPVVDGLLVNIIDPKEPGSIEGRVINATDLTRPPMVMLTPLLPGERRITAAADTTGNFVIPVVPPGAYTISAFIDMTADTVCGEYPSPADSTVLLTEPCFVGSDTLVVTPGEAMTLQPITLEGGRDDE